MTQSRPRYWLLGAVLLSVSTAAGAESAALDLQRAAAQLHGDLELIRVVMGRAAVAGRVWDVSDAHPRHAFYQAQTLHRKANQLATELGGASQHVPPPAPLREIEQQDVLAVVLAAHQNVRLVKVVLQIDDVAPLPASHETVETGETGETDGTEAANGLRSIMLASRQLNRLLDRQVKPEDVYRRLELAVGYTAGMIVLGDGLGDGDSAAMMLPAFEPGKMPRDVFVEVLTCMRTATAIGARHGVAVLQLDPGSVEAWLDIVPADVYDIVTTLLSDLAYLSWRVDARPLAPGITPPSHIFPSHVFQIASLLNEQLGTLAAQP